MKSFVIKVSIGLVLLMSFGLILVQTSQEVWGQTVDVKDIPLSETTTIEVKKGVKEQSPAEVGPSQKSRQIVDGKEVIHGLRAPLESEARDNLTEACKQWKKDFRKLTEKQGNQVISMSCGTVQCEGKTGSYQCQQDGTYKINAIAP